MDFFYAMELLFQNIQKHVPLSLEEQQLVQSVVEINSYPAKTILQQAGTISNQTYFVLSGVLRSFSVKDNIHEQILHFACEGWWIGDMYSYISEKPGHLFIEVLEDTEVVVITKENQQQLYQEIPKLERFFRILAENSLVAHQERLMDNLSLPAEERFEKMCNKYPTLIQRVAQKHLASFIGVTPEFFSKMKARLLKK
ncbi:MAG: Crp/Fnr family transcriptional regulator [Flavobacterium sp.]